MGLSQAPTTCVVQKHYMLAAFAVRVSALGAYLATHLTHAVVTGIAARLGTLAWYV